MTFYREMRLSNDRSVAGRFCSAVDRNRKIVSTSLITMALFFVVAGLAGWELKNEAVKLV
jgi:hypothetical protein